MGFNETSLKSTHSVTYDAELTAQRSQIREIGDQELLANIGYKQELKRSFSLLSMVGFCFSILTCWTAISGSMAESMLNGGPVSLVFGWIGACAFSLCVALAMADICSAYPVSGGQYSWCLFLGKGTRWGRGVSYICGWIQLAGIVCMAATGVYQTGLMIGAMANINTDGSFEPSNWRVVLFCYAAVVLNAVIAIFGNRILHYMTSGMLYWSLGGFVICTVVMLVRAPTYQTPSFVFTKSFEDSGWGLGMSVILGCMQAAYGIATYDSPAHLSEELNDASKDAPRAIVLSVIIGFLTGFGFILVLLFTIQDVEAVINTPTGFPLSEIFKQACHNKAGAMCLNAIVLVCGYAASQSLIVESSRSIYAFARDGGFPWMLNKWLVKVDPRVDVPVLAVLFSMAFEMAFISILFGSSTAFTTVLNIASAGLYVSYLMPICVALIRYKHKAPGYYNLGKWAPWIQIPGIIYLVFCSIFFFFPTTLPVTGGNMNYCVVAFGIDAVFGIVSWFGGARKSYAGGKENDDFTQMAISGIAVDTTQDGRDLKRKEGSDDEQADFSS